MSFRISFGSASCKDCKSTHEVCARLKLEMQKYSDLSFVQILNFTPQGTAQIQIGKSNVNLTIFREELSKKEVLLVFQAFYQTLRFPNFFSFSGVGKMYVEGVVFKSNDEKISAPDDLLHAYR